MPKDNETLTINKRTATVWFSVLGLIIAIGLGWFWWHNVYQDSTRVFWSMMDNNLSMASVVKHNAVSQQGTSTDQYTQMQFGPLSASHGLSNVKQQDNTVSSETIGTMENDFSRYINIKTNQKTSKGKAVDASSFMGIWGKTVTAPKGQRASVQYFQQSVLGIVAFGNFNGEQRTKLIGFLRSDNTYNLGQVKSAKFNGRAVYVYDVDISPQNLISFLKQYTKELGLGDIGLNPSQYAGSPIVKTQFTVDKLSHQLIKVHYISNNQDETYSSMGLEQPIILPTKTISINDLQNKVVESLK